jgi:hypothetical protein
MRRVRQQRQNPIDLDDPSLPSREEMRQRGKRHGNVEHDHHEQFELDGGTIGISGSRCRCCHHEYLNFQESEADRARRPRDRP